VRAFFQKYYHPGNASLALAGAIGTDEALALARKYFEELPAGPAVAPVVAPEIPRQDAEIRLLHEDRIKLPRLYLAWRSPALFADGDAAYDVIAEVLAGGKTSRLYRSLVHEKHMAIDVTALQQSRELDGMFQVIVTATPGVTLDTVAAAIDAELAKLMDHGPSADEMSRSLAQAEAQFIYRLQTVGGFNGKSDQLNAYNVYIADPGYFEADLERYRRLSIEDARDAARRLVPSQRVSLSVVPTGQASLALSDSTRAVVR
jgi:zinc protease